MSGIILPGGADQHAAIEHQRLADQDAERGTRRNVELLRQRQFRVTPAKRALTGLVGSV